MGVSAALSLCFPESMNPPRSTEQNKSITHNVRVGSWKWKNCRRITLITWNRPEIFRKKFSLSLSFFLLLSSSKKNPRALMRLFRFSIHWYTKKFDVSGKEDSNHRCGYSLRRRMVVWFAVAVVQPQSAKALVGASVLIYMYNLLFALPNILKIIFLLKLINEINLVF